MSNNDCLPEACLIENEEFTQEERDILIQIDQGNLDPAILMLSAYKGSNRYIFELMYSKLVEYNMIFEFVHLYRSRSTVGEMKSKIITPTKDVFMRALTIAMHQHSEDLKNNVLDNKRRIKNDVIQALYSMACNLRMLKTMLEMYQVFDVMPESAFIWESIGYIQYKMIPKANTEEKKYQFENIIKKFKEGFKF